MSDLLSFHTPEAPSGTDPRLALSVDPGTGAIELNALQHTGLTPLGRFDSVQQAWAAIDRLDLAAAA